MLKKLFKVETPEVHPALIAVWAALMSAAALLPSFPVIGSGGNFSVSYALAPLAGILFGPLSGATAVAIGDFIGSMIAPHSAPLGLLTFLINTSNAFVVGYICRKKWGIGLGFNVLMTIVWLAHPVPRDAKIFLLVYLAGILMTPIGGIWGSKLLNGEYNFFFKAVGLWMVSFPAYIAGSLVGNIITLWLYDLPAEMWRGLTPVVLIERTTFAVGAAVIGIPLLVALPKIGIYVGTQYSSDEEEVLE